MQAGTMATNPAIPATRTTRLSKRFGSVDALADLDRLFLAHYGCGTCGLGVLAAAGATW